MAESSPGAVPELSQQWIGFELANPYYPVLSNGVNHYLARYQAGLPVDGEFLWLDITVRKGQSSDNLKRFLVDNGAVWGEQHTVPLSLLERLGHRPEPERVVFEGGPFTTELIDRARVALTRKPTLIPDPEPTPAAKGVTGSSDGPAGARGSLSIGLPVRCYAAHSVAAKGTI